MKILQIALNGEEVPNYVVRTAFKQSFEQADIIWWQKEMDVNSAIIKAVTNTKYDAVFMQIQGANVINHEAAKAIYDNSIGFNWTGDVRKNIDWYIEFGKYFVTLFTNMTDVATMRKKGFLSEYFQIGYDHNIYYPIADTECHNNVVFCANHYPHMDFPLTDYRVEIVRALKNEFLDKFNLYGGNWNEAGLKAEYAHVNNIQEAQIYRTAAIAINCSHFDYSRYSSDRLLREMACGAFVLSHNYSNIEKDYKVGEHLDVFNDIDELIQKCHFYLNNKKERENIGRNAANYVRENANWYFRMKELKQIILTYTKN